MSVLKGLETRIAGLVEGAFGRAFRSEVRPVEIARKLAREMEEHKTVSLSRTYVPNEYAVYLSPDDHERVAGYEDELRDELAGYLLEHARQERLALVSRPVIEFHTDDRLKLGEFGIQTRAVKPGRTSEAEPEQGDVGHTMVYTAARIREEVDDRPATGPPQPAVVSYEGKRVVLGTSGAVLGRSRDCDVVLGDPNVSRKHAEIRPSGSGWVIADLGSTNGVVVNGRKIAGAQPLKRGDRVELGTSQLGFDLDA
jgi:hypothetical protein